MFIKELLIEQLIACGYDIAYNKLKFNQRKPMNFAFKKKTQKLDNVVVGDMSKKNKLDDHSIPKSNLNKEEINKNNDSKGLSNIVITSVPKSSQLNINKKVQRLVSSKKRKMLFGICILIIATILLGGFLLLSGITHTNKKDLTTKNVLTLNDLENSNVELTRKTSNASVDNLTKELKVKINKQIADKQNPIDAVNELAGVLSNTTNQNRQDQLTNFIEDFLANHEKTLWFTYEYNKPDQAQVNYWKAQLYAYLVNNYQNMAYYKFTDANGKPIDTTKQQLKYIDLYLALANDPASHPPIPEKDKEFIAGYVYEEADSFSRLKSSLSGGGAQR